MSCLETLKSNKWIVDNNLSILTWGNVSIADRDNSVMYIKPSGADLESITVEDISVVSLSTGARLAGLKESVDTKTHLELYNNFNYKSHA